MGTSKINADPFERLLIRCSLIWIRADCFVVAVSAQLCIFLSIMFCCLLAASVIGLCSLYRLLLAGLCMMFGFYLYLCCWLCFGLIPALFVNTTVHPIVFCAAVRFHLYVENPYICRWIYFGLIPALSVNTTVHSVVYVAAGSYDRHRHIYRYFDFTPATGTAWFYINRKKL